MMEFNNANEAFEYFYDFISNSGVEDGDTLAVFNTGFTILNPEDNYISCVWRKWSLKYAQREYKWYLSQNRSVEELKKYAPIWDNMHSGDNIVNSNYGWQWNRNDQLNKCIAQLSKNVNTRQAFISIYDGKEKDDYAFDTPCTLAIGFRIDNNMHLNMSVYMRSNDLFYGFCNDQYCFSELQKYVANRLSLSVGTYYHHSTNLHIYKNKLNLK